MRYLNTHQSEAETHTDKQIQEIDVIEDDDGRFAKEDTRATVTNKTVLYNKNGQVLRVRYDSVFNLNVCSDAFLEYFKVLVDHMVAIYAWRVRGTIRDTLLKIIYLLKNLITKVLPPNSFRSRW